MVKEDKREGTGEKGPEPFMDEYAFILQQADDLTLVRITVCVGDWCMHLRPEHWASALSVCDKMAREACVWTLQKAQANAEQQNRALRAAVNAEIRCRTAEDDCACAYTTGVRWQ